MLTGQVDPAEAGQADNRTAADLALERGLYAILALMGVVLVVGFALPALRPLQVVPRAGPTPAFALVDQDGRPVTERDLAGRAAVFSFLGLRGDAAAPLTLASLQRLREELRQQGWLGERVQLVTITLTPLEAPEALQTFAARQGADAREWLWLTGPSDAVYALAAGGFGVYYRREVTDAGETLVRTNRLVLVDEQGLLRTSYDSPMLDTARLVRDLGLLQQEAAAEGISRYAYEAAHLVPFICSPR